MPNCPDRCRSTYVFVCVLMPLPYDVNCWSVICGCDISLSYLLVGGGGSLELNIVSQEKDIPNIPSYLVS